MLLEGALETSLTYIYVMLKGRNFEGVFFTDQICTVTQRQNYITAWLGNVLVVINLQSFQVRIILMLLSYSK